MITANILIIGNEILSGNTLDTNSQFIASALKKIGIAVHTIKTVGDEVETIVKGLEECSKTDDLTFVTGGLGPTRDDKTKTAFAEFFNDKLTHDSATYAHLRALLIKRKREHLLEINRSQAEVLSKAKVFQNDFGTAPCQMIDHNDHRFFSLPGVPFEVKPLMRDKLIPYLKEKFDLAHIVSRTVSVAGIPESLLAQKLERWENELPHEIQLSYLPVGDRIKLQFTAMGADEAKLNSDIAAQIDLLKPIVKDYAVSWDGSAIEEILAEKLVDRKITISTAESCTGGQIARLLTTVSGAGQYFLGGVVAYNADMKSDVLGVDKNLIETANIVSEEVATAMAEGVAKLFKSDIAVATTGVAGPSSDEMGNEVGKICYTIKFKNKISSGTWHFPHLDRTDFMNFTAQRILQAVVQMLVQDE